MGLAENANDVAFEKNENKMCQFQNQESKDVFSLSLVEYEKYRAIRICKKHYCRPLFASKWMG